jgi:hypothetical protein
MKAEEQNQTSENGTLIRAAAAEADSKTETLRDSIDPIKIACAVRARIAAMKFPTLDDEQQAARVVASYSRVIDELIGNGADLGSIRQRVGAMEEACRRLTYGKPQLGFQDDLRAGIHEFLNQSWSTEEVEALKQYFSHDTDRIRNISISSVFLGDREITRKQVREEMRKQSFSNAHLFGYERDEAMALENKAVLEERRAHGR